VSVGRRNVVVLSTEVGAGHDEVHVEVCVIVLLEVYGLERQALEAGGAGQAVPQLLQLVSVYTQGDKVHIGKCFI